MNAGVAVLARAPFWPSLRTLRIGSNPFDAEGILELTRSGALHQLTHLDLDFARIGDEGAEALAACPGLSQLRSLRISNTGIGDRGVAVLASSPHLGRLRVLDLSGPGNHLTDAGARALAESAGLGELRRLWLGWCEGMTEAGEQMLAASPRLPHLLSLGVSYPGSSLLDHDRNPLLEHGKGIEL
jgi:Ran GTPase-activating protein (RanGAP) involved in mRNA processing and transport